MDAGTQSAETVQLLAVKVFCNPCLNKQEFSVKVYFVIFSTMLSINTFVQMVLVQLRFLICTPLRDPSINPVFDVLFLT